MMNVQKENLTTTLSDAGFRQEAIEKAERLWEAGLTRDLVWHLRLCRCELMDLLHESQKRVDRMDTLIWRIEKTMEPIKRKGGNDHDQTRGVETDPGVGQDFSEE